MRNGSGRFGKPRNVTTTKKTKKEGGDLSMAVLMKVILISKNEGDEVIEKATSYLYPGYGDTVDAVQREVS